MKKFTVLIVLAILAFSCSKTKENEPIAKQPKTDPMKEISLAKVNNASITANDLRNEFNMLSPQAQRMFMKEGGFEDLLNELVKKEMLYQEALKKDFTTKDEFKEMMDDYKKRVLIGFLLREEIEEKSQVTDGEVRKYYDDNKKEFMLEASGKGNPEYVDFDSVKNLIKQHLEKEKQSKSFDDYIAKIKQSYKVEIDKDKLASTFGKLNSPAAEPKVKPEQKK